MDTSHKPGNLSCFEVCEMLSDLIDVRAGEIPHPDGSRLSQPGVRPAVELHLAACAACREELRTMEEANLAFAEFQVGEPPAQYFEDFGQKVRARMQREEAVASGTSAASMPWYRAIRQSRWLTFAVSGLAAASFALAATRFLPTTESKTTIAQINRVEEPEVEVAAPAINPTELRSETPIVLQIPTRSPQGVTLVSQDFMHNPKEPASLNNLKLQEGSAGFLIFGERTTAAEAPLLGVYLRTTRDVDQVVSERVPGLKIHKVEMGSTAHRMGLRKDDYIVTINGMAVESGSAEDAVNFLAGLRQLGRGAPVTIHVVRPEGSQYLFKKPLKGVLGQSESPTPK